MDTKSTRHSRYHIYYHLVWIPKYRKKSLEEPVRTRLDSILREIAKDKGLEVCGLEIMPDHIHLFISSPPQHSPSLLINWFKGISSRLYNFRFKDSRIQWTNAYYTGTAGTVSKETIQKYIEGQTKCQDTKAESDE
ncbi:MAG: IS200/IS605 family transposase [Candidatus Methanoperedens sp.]|nr:IS200/IS605 family transposase [Candidatus Methanoperedens sp.]